MKLLFLILIRLFLQSLICKSQQISLIGSYLIPSNYDYKIFLSAENLDEESLVNVTLKSGSDVIDYRIYDEFNSSFFEEIQFMLTPSFPQNNYEIEISHTNLLDNSCNMQSVKLVDISRRPIVFIQTDKPVYRTNDEVKFRIFTLNQKLLPFDYENMDVTIYDSSGKISEKFSNLSFVESGVFENLLGIAESPNFGKWKIIVEVDGYRKSKSFEVQKMDDIQIDLEVNKFVAYKNKNFQLDILVKNPPENSFIGNAIIFIRGYFIGYEQEVLKYLNVTQGRNTVFIDFEKDLKIERARRDLPINIAVEVTEYITRKSSKAKTQTIMKPKGAHNITVLRSNHFRPGTKFPIKIQVKNFDVQNENSQSKLTISIDYHNFDQNTRITKSDKRKKVVGLNNGDASLQLSPSQDTRKIVLEIEFDGTEMTENIHPIPHFENEEYIQATVESESHHIGSTIEITVESSEEMTILHFIVISSEGIIISENYPDAESQKDYFIALKLTENMRPESTGIIYYVRKQDGSIVYDTFSISLGFTMGNSLAIAIADNASPKDTLNIHIKSENGSTVYLKVIEDAAKDEYEISTKSLEDEIVKYANLGFKDTSKYEIGQLNAFVLQPLSNGLECDSIDDDLNENFVDLDGDDSASSFAEILVKKYFPDVWIYDKIEVSGDEMLQVSVPDTITSWRTYGISMHPIKGFAISASDPKIQILTEAAVRIFAPDFVRESEVFRVDYGIFNYLKHPINPFIFIEIENGYFIHEEFEHKYDIECRTYVNKPEDRIIDSYLILASSMSEIKWFFVQPNSTNSVKIIISASLKEFTANGEKTVKIEGGERNIEEVNEDDENKNNVIESRLQEFDEIFTNYGYSEYKMSKFAASIVSFKHLQVKDESVSMEALKKVKQAYQEALYLLEYFIPKNNPPHLRFTSNILQNLLNARDIIAVDDTSIEDVAKFIISHQQTDGSFPYDQSSDFRRDIGSLYFKKHIRTAIIISPFLMDENLKIQFEEEIQKSIYFIKNPEYGYINDYEKVIIAYVLTLYGEPENSQFYISTMRKFFRFSTKHPKHLPMFVEIASYLIMTEIFNGNDPQEDVEWLISKRSQKGGFFGPYDTALAMQALYNYDKFKSLNVSNLDQNFLDVIDQTTVEFEGFSEILVEYEKKLEYQPVQLLQSFDVLVNVINAGNATINFQIITATNIEDIKVTNLVIIEAYLPSGYKYISHERAEHIRGSEQKQDGNFVIFYINGMSYDKTYIQTIKAERFNEIENFAEASVKIYDYYRPNLQTQITYTYDINMGHCKAIEEKERKRKSGIIGSIFHGE